MKAHDGGFRYFFKEELLRATNQEFSMVFKVLKRQENSILIDCPR
jgi:hypothetical protein